MTSVPLTWPLSWIDAANGRRADLDQARWFTTCEFLDPNGSELQARTGDEEGCLVVLSGCHDLYAGGGSWIERGVRDAPHSGRPVVVFLPPSTPFKIDGTDRDPGQVLRLGCRRPKMPPPTEPGRKPLLAMAGSGKAFDPNTGEWQRQETLPDAPEALLPRRIERRQDADGHWWEAILPADYKARALVADEVVVAADGELILTADAEPWSEEWLLLTVPAPGAVATARFGDGPPAEAAATAGLCGHGGAPLRVTSAGGPTWVLWARAGQKP